MFINNIGFCLLNKMARARLIGGESLEKVNIGKRISKTLVKIIEEQEPQILFKSTNCPKCYAPYSNFSDIKCEYCGCLREK